MKRDYLLEIGCENLPSSYLDTALRQMENKLESGLREERIKCGKLSVSGTPNRLVVYLEGLDDKQETLTEVIAGPPISRALSEDGSYNEAARGFARSKGVEVEKLIRIEREKGEYVAVEVKTEGMDSAEVLEKRLPEWITGIKFPKDMRWDRSGLVFARPVRWILSILSEGKLKIRLGKLASGNKTRLNPYFNEYTDVESIKHYFRLMKEAEIILDPAERRKAVTEAVKSEAAALGGRVVPDRELARTVSNLLESPVPLVGSFDRRFLKLPRQVVIAALKGHQRYFSVENESGELLPYFITFADGVSRNLEEIGRGNERVLQARLYDAEFYYMEDTAEPISEMASKLESIVWMRGMGTLADKSGRIGKLSQWIRSEWLEGKEYLDDIISRASMLAKADLASEMVKDGKEFTRLQGYIGREYARRSGEREEVAAAVYEHYLPRFAGDRLPESEAGIIISLADKMDNIAGGFLLGLNPTGSQDPYALRRQALGVLRIMIEREIGLPLRSLVRKALSLFSGERVEQAAKKAEEAREEAEEFFVQRLSGLLRGEGYQYDQDLVAAVLAAGWETPSGAVNLIRELSGMRERDELGRFTAAMKRVANIIGSSPAEKGDRIEPMDMIRALAGGNTGELPFSEKLLDEDAEKELLASSVSAASEILSCIEEGKAHRVFRILNERVAGRVNAFFEEVMVNCEDKTLRDNRHSFLRTLNIFFSRYCDYSLVQEE
ncbi:MAG: glycine--tRNA ligase subunit beta [Candidatus Krumholzibacteriales bacterium]